ncbi:MAG: hypothetical protein DHS20C13_30850 [Thermodesulfobacteriota bacterium]|nr:MAG: hypothetical protein DHS20C13_30850 [Thermodesulfobacteriota bacterium]
MEATPEQVQAEQIVLGQNSQLTSEGGETITAEELAKLIESGELREVEMNGGSFSLNGSATMQGETTTTTG